MKNVLLLLITLLNLSLISEATAQVTTPSQTAPTEVDTGVIFDAVMFEETVKIVVPMTENMAGEKYELDTIITFDADTY